MTGKNDLSGFKKRQTAPSSILKSSAVQNEQKSPSKPISADISAKKPQSSEALTARCQMLVTEAEKERIKAGRGLVPESTYLRIKLKEAGVI